MSETRANQGLLFALVVSACVAGGAGCATHRTHPYAEFDPQTKGVVVIGDDVVVPDPVPVSEKKKEMLKWVSFPGTTLTITFDEPTPFPRLHCTNNVCESGPIKEKSEHRAYDYHARLGSAPSSNTATSPYQKPGGDPKVIIEY
ncbi:MAG: hypothetical protein ABR610_11435 [Thermoanaerobaculia bacterium]|nr:hypothetical protein [Acidobacteriota bacterium]